MGVEESALGVVGILVSVDVTVVDAMITAPPLGGALEGGGSSNGKNPLKESVGCEGTMSEVAMVASSDTEAREQVKQEAYQHGLGLERNTHGDSAGHKDWWDADDRS
jgi:hypothetical protein